MRWASNHRKPNQGSPPVRHELGCPTLAASVSLRAARISHRSSQPTHEPQPPCKELHGKHAHCIQERFFMPHPSARKRSPSKNGDMSLFVVKIEANQTPSMSCPPFLPNSTPTPSPRKTTLSGSEVHHNFPIINRLEFGPDYRIVNISSVFRPVLGSFSAFWSQKQAPNEVLRLAASAGRETCRLGWKTAVANRNSAQEEQAQ
jgi:hypothetical protein